MAVTLREVAARAGVSVKTVSNVVNGYSFVTRDNRRRVQQAIDELGYVPNVGARNLRRGRTGFLTLAVPDLANPYFAEVSRLIMAAAAEHDWTVLIEQTEGVRERELAVINAAHRALADAVILSPISMRPTDLPTEVTGPPLVLLGERILDGPVDHVAIDNTRAASRATSHVASVGRRRIAAIGDQPGSHETAALRLAGYRSALAEAGLPPDPELVVPVPDYDRASGASAMRYLLDLPTRPDAVFCFNDLLAIGAIRAILDSGLRVPDDIAVIGFDNIAEGEFSNPRLSTIAPDKSGIAIAAIQLIRRRLDDPSEDPSDIVTPFTIEIRESTG